MAASLNYWHLTHSWDSTRKLAEWVHDEMELEQIVCPIDPGHRRGGKRLTDLSVTLPGGKVEDIVWTWQGECLIQDCVLCLFRDNQLTGFEVKPVKAHFKKNIAEPLPKLWELVVTGWGGMASPESGVRLERACDGCGLLKYSRITNPDKLIDATRYDGSDFIIVWPLPSFIFVSDRAANLIRGERLNGAILKPLSSVTECYRFIAPGIGHSPGRLSSYMSEARARQLGEALGIA